ncbi:hypothetical protein D6833_12220 [Candidatus Parcubacteria bacterium]|nr:MAG: hypothetical protein D6833_12220 [Candidatus Parcubacteria bacterium]
MMQGQAADLPDDFFQTPASAEKNRPVFHSYMEALGNQLQGIVPPSVVGAKTFIDAASRSVIFRGAFS